MSATPTSPAPSSPTPCITEPARYVGYTTTGNRAAASEKRLRERPPYDTPQWYAVKADRAGADYLDWATGTENLPGNSRS